MLAYWIDYAFGTISKGPSTSFTWRVPLILQCMFLVPMLLIIAIIPETPRWLAAHDRNEDALAVLQRLNKGKMTDDQIQAIHREIVETVALETSIDSGSWKDLLHDDGKSRTRTSNCQVLIRTQKSTAADVSSSLAAFKHSNSWAVSMR